MVLKTQAISNKLVHNSSRATTKADVSAETLARTTADGLQNTAISNNTDATQKEATTRMQ
jgi:hypothetical protein